MPQQSVRAQDFTPVAYSYLPRVFSPEPEPIRSDDFQDGVPQWYTYFVKDDPKDGEFFHAGGMLQGRIWDNSAWVVASPRWRPLGDFQLEMDARFVDDRFNNYVNTLGLVFGGEIVYDARGNLTFAEFYEFTLAYNKAQHLWAVRRRNADWTVVDLDDFDGVPSFVGSYDSWNHFRVRRILDKIHVYCNGRRMPGQPSEGYTDGTYGTRRMVGVSVGSWELDRGDMDFDNFLLTPLSGPY
jgi:hypothetical protein